MEKCNECPFKNNVRENKYCQLCIKTKMNGFVTIDVVLDKTNWKNEILNSRKEC